VVVRTRATKLHAPALTQADVEALSAARNEPRWLLESRLAAWELYEEMPMPPLTAEEWRRTDYTTIKWEQAGPLTVPGRAGFATIPAENRAPLIGNEQGGLIAAVDGKIVHSELDEALINQGVIFTDLETAIRAHEDLVPHRSLTRAVLPGRAKYASL